MSWLRALLEKGAVVLTVSLNGLAYAQAPPSGHELDPKSLVVETSVPTVAAAPVPLPAATKVLRAEDYPQILGYRTKQTLPLEILAEAVTAARLEAANEHRLALFKTSNRCFARNVLFKEIIDDKLRLYRVRLEEKRTQALEELYALEAMQKEKLASTVRTQYEIDNRKDPADVRALSEPIANAKKKLADIDKQIRKLPTTVEDCSSTIFVKENGLEGEFSYHTAAVIHTPKGPLVFDPYNKTTEEVRQGLLLTPLREWIPSQKFNDPVLTLAPATYVMPFDFGEDWEGYAGWKQFDGKIPSDPVYRARKTRSLDPARVKANGEGSEETIAESKKVYEKLEPISPENIRINVKGYLDKLPGAQKP